MNLPPPSLPGGLPHVGADRIDANWRAISVELDAPAPSRLERALRRIGFPAVLTRPVAATPALRRAWFAAIAVVVTIGLGATDPDDPRASLFVLLFLAPIVPLLGVALSFGSASDPAHEAQLATPMHGLRLVAIRAVTVLVVSFGVVGGLSALSDVARPYAAVWILPALALTTAALAAMTIATPRRAAAGVGGVWLGVALVGRAIADDQLAAFGTVAQLACAAIAVASVAALVVRRDRFEFLVVPS